MSAASFTGEHDFLSNFYASEVEYKGLVYPTVEHAYQSAKFLDEPRRRQIRGAPTPGKAKQFGQRAGCRADWERVKRGIMARLVRRKFADPDLRERLLATDGELVEGNVWHDNTWGNCTCPRCRGIAGLNWLGEILMAEREAIQQGLRDG